MTQRIRSPLTGRRPEPAQPDIPNLEAVTEDGLTTVSQRTFPAASVVNLQDLVVTHNLSSVTDKDNILLNGGFEVDTAGWGFSLCTGARATSSPAPAVGEGYLKVTSTSGGTIEVYTPQGVDGIPVLPGEAYEIDYWCRQETGNNTFYVFPYFFDQDGAVVDTGNEEFGFLTGQSAVWQHRQPTAWVVPEDARFLSVEVIINGTTAGKWYALDEIRLRKSSYLDVGHITVNSLTTSDDPFQAPRVELGSYPVARFWGGRVHEENAGAIYPTLSGTDDGSGQYGLLLQSPTAFQDSSHIELRSESYDGTSWPASIYFNGRPYHFYHSDVKNVANCTGGTYASDTGWRAVESNIMSFTKHYSNSILVITLMMTGYADTATGWRSDIGVTIGGTPYHCGSHYWNTTLNHRTLTGQVKVTGLAAGTYTAIHVVERSATSSTGVFKTDSNDVYTVRIDETWTS